jgi:hypothetical protein
VFREFGGEGFHDRLVAVESSLTPKQITCHWLVDGSRGRGGIVSTYGGRRLGMTSADGDRRRHTHICRISPTTNVANATTT